MEMGLKWREDALSTPHPDMAMRPHYHPVPSSPFSWGYTMVATVFDVESTLTDRYQTTVPETVRCALGLGKRDKIHYAIHPGGEVVLSRAQAPEMAEMADPVLDHFLGFLAQDIANHPERQQTMDAGFVQGLQTLVGKVEVDLGAALSADDRCVPGVRENAAKRPSSG